MESLLWGLQFIMESGVKGYTVMGTPRTEPGAMKFLDGVTIHSGDPANYYVLTTMCHVPLRVRWASK